MLQGPHGQAPYQPLSPPPRPNVYAPSVAPPNSQVDKIDRLERKVVELETTLSMQLVNMASLMQKFDLLEAKLAEFESAPTPSFTDL
jgi:hypothetical protein